MSKDKFELRYLCSTCGSTRAVVASKAGETSPVHCSSCHRALGYLGDIQRELVDKAREDGRTLAKKIYRTSRRTKGS